jgi:hypothetical protein
MVMRLQKIQGRQWGTIAFFRTPDRKRENFRLPAGAGTPARAYEEGFFVN